MNCPGCESEIGMVLGAVEGVVSFGLCARCGSFVAHDGGKLRLMKPDEIAELPDDKRNMMVRLRRRIEDASQHGDPLEIVTAPVICEQCGPFNARLSYVARFVNEKKTPPCPKCGAKLRPDHSQRERSDS